MAPVSTSSDPKQSDRAADPAPVVTAFVCANCYRPGQAPDSGGLRRTAVPSFDWPFPVQELLVSCTGRIQPEHVLKAFESGANLVCAIACAEDNCHYLEGSKRCARRVDYIRAVLDEIGLGSERLMLFHLPGTAAEDTALGCGRTLPSCTIDSPDSRVAAIREAVIRALDELAPNPLYTPHVAAKADGAYQQVDNIDEDNED